MACGKWVQAPGNPFCSKAQGLQQVQAWSAAQVCIGWTSLQKQAFLQPRRVPRGEVFQPHRRHLQHLAPVDFLGKAKVKGGSFLGPRCLGASSTQQAREGRVARPVVSSRSVLGTCALLTGTHGVWSMPIERPRCVESGHKAGQCLQTRLISEILGTGSQEPPAEGPPPAVLPACHHRSRETGPTEGVRLTGAHDHPGSGRRHHHHRTLRSSSSPRTGCMWGSTEQIIWF